MALFLNTKGGARKSRTGASAGAPGTSSFRGPKIAALDYRTGSGAFNVSTHQKYDISIIGMLTTQAASNGTGVGYNFVQSLKAANPDVKVFQYTIATQMYARQDGYANYGSISDLLDAGGVTGPDWWARNSLGNKTKTGPVTGYPSWEANITTYVAANSNGRKAYHEIARFFHNTFSGVFAAGLDGYFQDNVWGGPGSSTSTGAGGNTIDSAGNTMAAGTCADYNLTGGDDSLGLNSVNNRTVSPAPGFRAGLAGYANEIKTLRPGTLMIANADFDNRDDANYGITCLSSTEMVGVYDYAFMEGFVGKSYSLETYRNLFADSMRRYSTTEASLAAGGAAILNAYVNTSTQSLSRRLQYCRYAQAITLLRDGYCCVQDQATNAPYWYNECDPAFVPIGTRTGSLPVAATSNGIWTQTYQNGIAIVNPVANKGRWVGSVSGSWIKRTGNVTTLNCSTLTGLAVGDLIRLTDFSNAAFNGTFTLTGASAGVFTWNSTGADITQVNSPAGFAAGKSTIDLTGQGYKRFLGTDDAHNDYDNGTSQNDGTVITTVTLWAGDGLIAIKA